MNFSFIILLAIIALGLFVTYKIMSKFKVPKIGCIALVTGGVKTGKSTFAVNLAIKTYNRVHRGWKIRAFIQRLLHVPVDEEPLLYSNIPLAVPYVELTKDIIMRRVRPRFKSVLYFNEASLLASKDTFRDLEQDERIMLFNKLFGHETHGGYCIYDTQAIVDLNCNIRRCLSEYYYIHHLEKHIPFVLCAKVREERYSEDGTVVNSYNDDLEDSLKKVLISKRVWKKFDAYCFSSFTDDLPVESKVVCADKNDMKVKSIVSFRRFLTIRVRNQGVKKNNENSTSSGRQAVDNKGNKQSNEVRDETSQRV